MPWLWAIGAVYALALAAALVKAPWWLLWTRARAQHLSYGCALALMLLWWLRGGLPDGPDVHFLGVTAATLVLGWPLAVLAVFVAVLGAIAMGLETWPMGMAEGLLLGVVPALVSHVNVRILAARLPANPFVYMLGGAFFGGVLAGLVGRSALGAVLALGGTPPSVAALDQWGAVILLTALPEGVINGMVISPLVVYRPEWLATFDRQRYLGE